MSRPVALVLAAAGTNRDHDVAFALDLAGAESRIVLLADLVERPALLDSAQIVVIAGGFSYADALGAGRMFALQLEHRVGDVLRSFVDSSRPVIGICNGFQVLTRMGLLPGALGHICAAPCQKACRRVEDGQAVAQEPATGGKR